MSDELLKCDFCGSLNPPWMYANPFIHSDVLHADLLAGHFSACEPCGKLLEAGRIDLLVTRVLDAYRLDADLRVRDAFAAIYSQISRVREAMLPPEEYKRQRMA